RPNGMGISHVAPVDRYGCWHKIRCSNVFDLGAAQRHRLPARVRPLPLYSLGCDGQALEFRVQHHNSSMADGQYPLAAASGVVAEDTTLRHPVIGVAWADTTCQRFSRYT